MIRKILATYPRLDKALRHLYRRAQFVSTREPGFTHWIDPRLTLQTPWQWAGVPPEQGEMFFGYYDKTPWSPDERSLLMHLRRSRYEPQLQICTFPRQDHALRAIGLSRAWSFQQGTMAQWVMHEGQLCIIYNDVVDDKLVARLVTETGEGVNLISVPVQAVHPNGKTALSLNYKRLLKLRREYGYTVSAKNFSPDMPLNKDGVWRADLVSGKAELVITLAELMQIEPRPELNPKRTKVNHILYSPSGARCIFMHRWFNEGTKYSRLYTMDSATMQLQLVLDSPLISHYHWFDDERLIIYGSTPAHETGYFELNVLTGSHRMIGTGVLNRFGDGHPSISPDKSWVVTDTYPDRRFQQRLLLYNLASGQLIEAGRFLHSPQYYNVTRCDLHPRWSRSGKYVSFDSVWNGARQSYILNVSTRGQ